MNKFPILYKRTSKNQIQQWQVIANGNSYYTLEGIVDGKITQSEPHICEGKNPGKANETTATEQAYKEAQSTHEKKLRRGYMTSVESVDETSFEKPMKGDTWADRREEVIYPVLVSDKLNGIRVRINKTRAFSTGGETFYTIPHIHKALKALFTKYPDLVLDGEGFNYELRENLNRLIKLLSVTPELLAESEKIVQFHIFDAYGYKGITKETPYSERYFALVKLLHDNKIDKRIIKYVNVDKVDSEEKIMMLFAANKILHGEGLIIRWGDCPYKHGRSKYLLKLKHFEDAEFEIVDLEEGNGDWAGAAKRACMKMKDGTTFNSNILGSYPELKKMLQNKKKVIGEIGTVRYQHLSEYNVPQIPWLIAIRNYE